jgi:hypothetical protein
MASGSRLRNTAAVTDSLWTSKPTQNLTDDGMGLVSLLADSFRMWLWRCLARDANWRHSRGGQPFHRVYATLRSYMALDHGSLGGLKWRFDYL